MRSAVKKVVWLGRATVFMVGLTVVLAIVLGVATAGLAATGGNFILGKGNTATTPTNLVSTLTDAVKSALVVQNKSGGPALDLRVGSANVPANNVAPMKVNSNKVVTDLNADKLDGKDSTDFATKGAEPWHEVGAAGEPPFSTDAGCADAEAAHPCGWQNLDTNHNSAAFFKDPSGVVHLKGLVSAYGCDFNTGDAIHCIGPSPSLGGIFTLPAGYRPARREVQVTISESKLGRATITPDGQVIPEIGIPSWFSLDGITFRAAN